MGQMSGLAKGVFLLIIFILRGASLIVQTAFRDGLSFDHFSFGRVLIARAQSRHRLGVRFFKRSW